MKRTSCSSRILMLLYLHKFCPKIAQLFVRTSLLFISSEKTAILTLALVQYQNFFKSPFIQGRHGQFLPGKGATVVATLAVYRPCHRRFLFCKIQARPRPWGPCQLWRPWEAVSNLILSKYICLKIMSLHHSCAITKALGHKIILNWIVGHCTSESHPTVINM